MGATRTARRFPASEGSAMEGERDWRRLGWGVLLILLGGIFLLDRFEGLPEWALSFKWWPLIVVALGLLRLVGTVGAADRAAGLGRRSVATGRVVDHGADADRARDRVRLVDVAAARRRQELRGKS